MGVFNTVRAEAECPRCSSVSVVGAQFKFGDTWQYEYVVGDALRWGGNDIGAPGSRRVVVDGAAEDCPACGFDDDWDMYVFVQNDEIVAVERATGRHDFVAAQATFIVLDE